MYHATARLIEPLLRWWFPTSGRHRTHHPRPSPPLPSDTPTLRLPCPYLSASRGERIGIVRPYLVAHERREEVRRQRARRRVVWLAPHGIDAGPRSVSGLEVAAR